MTTGTARLRIAGPTSLTRLMESSPAGAGSADTVGVPAAAGMVADGWVLPGPVSPVSAVAVAWPVLAPSPAAA